MKLAWEHFGRYTTSIQQVCTRETLASAIKTDASRWTWDSRTHWTQRGDGWGCSGGAADRDLGWLQGSDSGGGRIGDRSGSCHATSIS